MRAGLRGGAAAFLAFAAFFALAWRAWDSVAPLPVSFSVMAKFWRAGSTTRLLNTQLFRREPEFGAALVKQSSFLPLESDVVLTVPAGLPDGKAEEMRRKAAFVLAPRRVVLRRAETGRDGFSIARSPVGNPP